jgi:cell wall-associated NlpC family hydrolase
VTARTTARHRAEAPVSTPLTTMTSALAEKVPTATAARSGLVLAVSGGLVAGVGLPAEAATPRSDEATTASLKLPALTPATDQVAVDQAVSAPATAKVHFERSAMSASQAKAAPVVDGTARAADGVATVSRSLARAAYGQQVEKARRAAAAKAVKERQAPRVSRDAPRSNPSPAPVPSNGSLGSRAISIASRYFGVPYRYGGTTPRGFDCSGLVQYVYAQLGVRLPRTAQQQYGATRRVSRSAARPGDLVFFFGGGGISHVGIYAGGNMMIAAPHSGTVVRKQPIYSANVAFGRVS